MSDANGRPVSRNEAFSGHESFPCRYGWLPKLHEAVAENAALFADEEGAMVVLGLGKNMVRSIRFWGEVLGTTRTTRDGVEPTALARLLLDPASGRDPYLEDPASLWRLHWILGSKGNLGAWNVAFHEVHDPVVTRPRLIELVHARACEAKPGATATTSAAHVDIFLRTYDAARTADGAALEETLGSPFQELGLVETAELGGTHAIRLLRGPKAGLDVPTMAFALLDHWEATQPCARTMTFRSAMLDPRSPGIVFRLDETATHGLLEALCERSVGRLALQDDGAGGTNLTCMRGDPLAILGELAWS